MKKSKMRFRSGAGYRDRCMKLETEKNSFNLILNEERRKTETVRKDNDSLRTMLGLSRMDDPVIIRRNISIDLRSSDPMPPFIIRCRPIFDHLGDQHEQAIAVDLARPKYAAFSPLCRHSLVLAVEELIAAACNPDFGMDAR